MMYSELLLNNYMTSRKEAEIVYVYTTHVQPALPWAIDSPAIHQSEVVYIQGEAVNNSVEGSRH